MESAVAIIFILPGVQDLLQEEIVTNETITGIEHKSWHNRRWKTAFKKALKKAGLSKDKVSSWKIIKLSIDARKKAEIHKVYVIGLYVKEYNKTRKDVQIITKEKEYTYEISGTKKSPFHL